MQIEKGDVFILGSGFSASASNGAMPTVRGLEPIVTEFVRENPKIDERWLLRTDELLIAGDLEAFFDYLVMPQPFLLEADRLRNHAAFLAIAERIADHLAGCQAATLAAECPPWLEHLVRVWHDTRTEVVTLNYDTLVESTLWSLELVASETGSPITAEEPLALGVQFARAQGLFGGHIFPLGVPTFRLSKLHGSLSWYYPGSPGPGQPVRDVGLYGKWGRHMESPRGVRRYVPGMVPYLAPPTLAKDAYFDHELIRQLWVGAASALAAADRVVFMGYSLPHGDVTMRTLLQTTVFPDTELIVLDACKHTGQRYRELFGNDIEIDVEPESIRRFAEALT